MQVHLRGLQVGGHRGRGYQHEDLPRDAPDGSGHGTDVHAAVPEAREGCLIAEDEHETDDDGEGWDLEGGLAQDLRGKATGRRTMLLGRLKSELICLFTNTTKAAMRA